MNDDDIDQRARDLAQGFRDDVAGTVDLGPAQARVTRRSRGPVGVVLAAIAVLALVAVGITAQDEGDVEVAVDEDEDDTTTTGPEAEPSTEDFQIDGPGLALGAPDDGKDSVGLPVDADPATGLVDAQTVTVYGAQFPPNAQVGVVMCTKEAGREHGGRGAEACDLGHVAYADSDADGDVQTPFTVRRFLLLDGQEVDCASEEGRCLIGMGLIADYDQSGGVEVSFDASAPVPDPPTVELSETSGLTDGQAVAMHITGVRPGSVVQLQQCGVVDAACLDLGTLTADGDGTVDSELALWRIFGGHPYSGDPMVPRNPDCARETCVLRVFGESSSPRGIPDVELSFDDTGEIRRAPTLRVLDDGPFAPGGTIPVEIDGITEDTMVDLQLCHPEAGMCLGYGGQEERTETSVRISFVIEDAYSGQPCAEGCPLLAYLYSSGGASEGEIRTRPPELFPEPVTVVVTA